VRALVAESVLADRAALADALARVARDLDWSPEVERAALRALTRRADEYVGFCVRTRTVAETLALAAPMLIVDDATLAFLFGGRAAGEEARPAVLVASPEEFVASLDLSPGTRVPFAEVLRGYAAARGLAEVPSAHDAITKDLSVALRRAPDVVIKAVRIDGRVVKAVCVPRLSAVA